MRWRFKLYGRVGSWWTAPCVEEQPPSRRVHLFGPRGRCALDPIRAEEAVTAVLQVHRAPAT
eukprot:3879132-Prymnesium_polylepis.1